MPGHVTMGDAGPHDSGNLDCTHHDALVVVAEAPAAAYFVIIIPLSLPATQRTFNVPAIEAMIRVRRTILLYAAFPEFPTRCSRHRFLPLLLGL